ncbi:MAG: glycosyltransferase [Sphingomonas sp.]|uniref:glycosyltransferase n=1 Tax=Sphingomonas sp. TaxID=28214 RepID=UPI001AC69D67|nr:glycosyltransferase [Sphingomonas sp.]MBN8808846.1 glycosyltransferase [Sphingomonas sp.]
MTDPAAANPAGAVGYVMTHYPRNAQTFIAGEIDSVMATGMAVETFAMNRPDAVELAVPRARERSAATHYLKDRPLGAIGDAIALTLRHPIGMARIKWLALTSAGGSPRRMARRLAHFVQAARVARVAQRQGIRHLHAHFGLAPATIAWFASRIIALDGKPAGFSFTIHGFHDFVDPAETRLDLKAPAAAAVVCVSDFTRGQLFLQADSAIWPRAHVVRCGVDLTAWQFAPRERGSEAPTIVALGRLSPEKGFSVLLDAMARLRDAGVVARLLLIGEGPERGALEAAIARFDLADRVTLMGELAPADVRTELRRADIFCLPSFSEGLPVSIMEAMAAGVPVVTTWIAGIPELAENGVTAWTVPPARADALADALREAIENPALAATRAAAGRARVEQLHDQAANGRAMADLLRRLGA